MKKSIILVLLMSVSFAFAQEETSKKWFFGFGVNFLDNSSSSDDEYFSVKNWNVIPSVSTFSVQRKFDSNFSVNGQFLLNKLDKSNKQNGEILNEDLFFASINANLMYTFDSHIVDVKWFDASALAGVGAMWTDGTPNQTINAGIALDFWLNKAVALRLETQGKFAFDQEQVGNDHIVHTVSIILPIN